HRRGAVPEARQDRGAGRRHLERGIRHLEQVAAPAGAVLDRPDSVPALSTSKIVRPSRRIRRPAASFPKSASAPAGALLFIDVKVSCTGTLFRVALYPCIFRSTDMLVERGLRVMN